MTGTRTSSVLTVICCVVYMLIGASAAAQTQDARLADGSPSPRTAPVLAPGDYEGALLTGETVWYAVLVPDGADIDLSVELVEDNGRTDLDLEVAFLQNDLVTPIVTRNVDRAGESARVEGTASNSGLGSGQTVPWNLRVTLRSDGRVGEPLDAKMSIEGTAQPTAGATCGPPCPPADELDELNEQVRSLQEDLEAAQTDAASSDDPRIAELEEAIDADRRRLEELNAAIGDASEGGASQWPVTRFVVLGVIAVALLIWGLSKRRGAAESPDTDGSDVDEAERPQSVPASVPAVGRESPQRARERLVGDPHEDAPAVVRDGVDGRLVITYGESEQTAVPGDELVAGRDPSCDITLDDRRVSRRHVVFAFTDGAWTMTDLGSKRGTFVQDERTEHIALSGTTTVTLGPDSDSAVLEVQVDP